MSRMRSFSNYAVVAIAAAALSSAVTLGAVKLVGPAEAQTAAAPGSTRQLVTQALSDATGREVRILELNRPPGDASAPHQHPGAYTFGYVVEGTYEFGVNGGPTKMLHAGDTFYEPPGSTHSVSHNAGDKPMKIVVFMVTEQKNPTTIPAK